MNFESAVTEFRTLLAKLNPKDTTQFLHWTKKTIDETIQSQRQSNADVLLDNIRAELRASLPQDATTYTEVVICPQTGPNTDCDPRAAVHVDGFLYDDDVIDDLCDEGKFSRNYCVACGSHKVKPLTFITHSASVLQIKYIFQYLLQDLSNKTLLDVGSRTGAILYGAYLYSECQRIVGVEIDPTFCQLQQATITRALMTDRIQVIHGDILQQLDVLQASDVVILNNAFDFFMPVDIQAQIWKFLRQALQKEGIVVITIPSVEEILSKLQGLCDIDVVSWLQLINTSSMLDAARQSLCKDEEYSDLDTIFMYQVI